MAVRSGWRPLFIKLSSGKFNILSGKCQGIPKLGFCGNYENVYTFFDMILLRLQNVYILFDVIYR